MLPVNFINIKYFGIFHMCRKKGNRKRLSVTNYAEGYAKKKRL